MIKNNKFLSIKNIAILSIILLMEIFFFRALFTDGAMIGEINDSRLNNLIMEHWYHFFQRTEKFDTLSEFYSYTGTVSYTDMLFADGIFYSILRFIGVGMYTANTITLVVVHLCGSVSLYYLLNSILDFSSYAAFLGVITFSFGNGYAVRIGHTQMMALSLLPLILCFGIAGIKSFDNKRRRHVDFSIFVVLFALLAYTGWYTFYFSCVFTLIGVIVYLIILITQDKTQMEIIAKAIASSITEIICYIVGFILLLVPFLMIYLPTSKMVGSRDWSEVSFYSPQPIDIINVGDDNVFFGKIITQMNFSVSRSKGEWELCVGFSIVLLVALLYFLIRFFRDRSNKDFANTTKKWENGFVVAAVITIAFTMILPLEVGGYSIWYLFYKNIPGAGSLRGVARWFFFLLLPLGMIFAYFINRYVNTKTVSKGVLIGFAVLLWYSNVNLESLSRWNANDQEAYVESVTTPPDGAKIMALQNSDPKHIMDQQGDMLNSWVIANHFGLKTINGYSGFFPPGYPLADVTADDYIQRIEQYKVDRNITEAVYVYDEWTKEWKEVK